MTLQQLKYFIVTADSSSIAKAAERLYVTKPSLSGALRDLETEIGHSLFSRSSKGICLTKDGAEFLVYAQKVIEQAALLEERWVATKPAKGRLHIISEHWAFAVKAFIRMVEKHGMQDYNYRLHEGKAFDIIEEVKLLRSDIGVFCRDRYSRPLIDKLLNEGGLEFHPLFVSEPYVLLRAGHPLAVSKSYLTPEDVSAYPRIVFETSAYSPHYFSEEEESVKTDQPPEKIPQGVKIVPVEDRATMLHLLLGIDGYALTAGLQGIDLYGGDVIALPFRVGNTAFEQEAGWIACKGVPLEKQLVQYVEELALVAAETGSGEYPS